MIRQNSLGNLDGPDEISVDLPTDDLRRCRFQRAQGAIAYCRFNYLKGQPKFSQPDHLTAFALGYFLVFTFIAYLLYVFRKEKG